MGGGGGASEHLGERLWPCECVCVRVDPGMFVTMTPFCPWKRRGKTQMSKKGLTLVAHYRTNGGGGGGGRVSQIKTQPVMLNYTGGQHLIKLKNTKEKRQCINKKKMSTDLEKYDTL